MKIYQLTDKAYKNVNNLFGDLKILKINNIIYAYYFC